MYVYVFDSSSGQLGLARCPASDNWLSLAGEPLDNPSIQKYVDLAADHGGIVASLGDLEQPLAIM